jgi:hypothetical protein
MRMSGKGMILTLPRFPSSEELQEPGNACRELEIKGKERPGQDVFEQDRERYDLAVKMMRDQLPVRHIAKTAQISFSTISAIRRHAGLSVETEKEALTDTIRTAARVVSPAFKSRHSEARSCSGLSSNVKPGLRTGLRTGDRAMTLADHVVRIRDQLGSWRPAGDS